MSPDPADFEFTSWIDERQPHGTFDRRREYDATTDTLLVGELLREAEVNMLDLLVHWTSTHGGEEQDRLDAEQMLIASLDNHERLYGMLTSERFTADFEPRLWQTLWRYREYVATWDEQQARPEHLTDDAAWDRERTRLRLRQNADRMRYPSVTNPLLRAMRLDRVALRRLSRQFFDLTGGAAR